MKGNILKLALAGASFFLCFLGRLCLAGESYYSYGAGKERIDGAGTIYYYVNDKVDSARVILNEDQSVEWSSDYQPYGQEVNVQAAGAIEDKTFSGKEHDQTGLYYFGARYYDPRTGRFVSVDPARENPYAYVDNNPLGFVDPDGRRKGKGRYWTSEELEARLQAKVEAMLLERPLLSYESPALDTPEEILGVGLDILVMSMFATGSPPPLRMRESYVHMREKPSLRGKVYRAIRKKGPPPIHLNSMEVFNKLKPGEYYYIVSEDNKLIIDLQENRIKYDRIHPDLVPGVTQRDLVSQSPKVKVNVAGYFTIKKMRSVNMITGISNESGHFPGEFKRVDQFVVPILNNIGDILHPQWERRMVPYTDWDKVARELNEPSRRAPKP